ncbi:hypothetical protein BH23GEM3_BH23GEM3_09510 [soil metagenome]
MRRNRGAGCVVGVLLVLVVVGVFAWLFRGDLMQRWAGGDPATTAVSLEAAASAEAKLERLRTQGEVVRLSAVELTSLARYRLGNGFPDLLQDPVVELGGDTLHVAARVPSERLPNLRELDRVRAFLPDTARIDLTGRFLPRDEGRTAIQLHHVAVAGVPIPARFYPDILERLGRRDEPGLPADAIALTLPEGVGSARVEDGFLVLTP